MKIICWMFIPWFRKNNRFIIRVQRRIYWGQQRNKQWTQWFYAENGFSVVNVNYTSSEGNFQNSRSGSCFTVLNWSLRRRNRGKHIILTWIAYLWWWRCWRIFLHSNLMAAVLYGETLSIIKVSSGRLLKLRICVSCRYGYHGTEETLGWIGRKSGWIYCEIHRRGNPMDDEIMGHAGLYSIINNKKHSRKLILTTGGCPIKLQWVRSEIR